MELDSILFASHKNLCLTETLQGQNEVWGGICNPTIS